MPEVITYTLEMFEADHQLFSALLTNGNAGGDGPSASVVAHSNSTMNVNGKHVEKEQTLNSDQFAANIEGISSNGGPLKIVDATAINNQNDSLKEASNTGIMMPSKISSAKSAVAKLTEDNNVNSDQDQQSALEVTDSNVSNSNKPVLSIKSSPTPINTRSQHNLHSPKKRLFLLTDQDYPNVPASNKQTLLFSPNSPDKSSPAPIVTSHQHNLRPPKKRLFSLTPQKEIKTPEQENNIGIKKQKLSSLHVSPASASVNQKPLKTIKNRSAQIETFSPSISAANTTLPLQPESVRSKRIPKPNKFYLLTVDQETPAVTQRVSLQSKIPQTPTPDSQPKKQPSQPQQTPTPITTRSGRVVKPATIWQPDDHMSPLSSDNNSSLSSPSLPRTKKNANSKRTTSAKTFTSSPVGNQQDRPFPCHHASCDRAFRTNYELLYHIRVVHSGIRPYLCPRCPATFTKKSNADAHQRVHSDLRPYPCSLCPGDRAFKHPRALKRHQLSKHSQERPFPCTPCQSSFKFRYSLTKHERNFHGTEDCQSSRLRCRYCPKWFDIGQRRDEDGRGDRKVEAAMTAHQRSHRAEIKRLRQLSCETCGKALPCLKRLNSHRLVHNLERPHVCQSCQMTFKRRHHLTRHRLKYCKDRHSSPSKKNK